MISPTTDNQLKYKGREEGYDDPEPSRKAMVTWGNAGWSGAGHGSGIGSGTGSVGGRSSPRLAQRPGRRARPGWTARSGRRVGLQDSGLARRREGAAGPGADGVGTVSSRFSGTRAGVGGCSSVPHASGACGTGATLRDHPLSVTWSPRPAVSVLPLDHPLTGRFVRGRCHTARPTVQRAGRVLETEAPRRQSEGLRERKVSPLSILALFRSNSRSAADGWRGAQPGCPQFSPTFVMTVPLS